MTMHKEQDADVVRDFESRITPHILRNWNRERIVRFAKHLLGDECQECPKHNTKDQVKATAPEQS